MKAKNHRVFEVYFLPATDKKGARLKINDLRHRKSITISRRYDDSYDLDAHELAELELGKLGIAISGFGEAKRGFLLFTEDFSTSIK